MTLIGRPRLRRERSPPRQSGVHFRAARRHRVSSNSLANALASSQGLPLSSPRRWTLGDPVLARSLPGVTTVDGVRPDHSRSVVPQTSSSASVRNCARATSAWNPSIFRRFVPVPAVGPPAAPIQSRRSTSVCRRPSVSQWPDPIYRHRRVQPAERWFDGVVADSAFRHRIRVGLVHGDSLEIG